MLQCANVSVSKDKLYIGANKKKILCTLLGNGTGLRLGGLKTASS